MSVSRTAVRAASRGPLRSKLWLLVWVIGLMPTLSARADDSAPSSPPTASQCIALHVEGQSLRNAGSLLAAAAQLKQCLHPSCSPLLREDCAELLEAVERETPSVVFAAKDGDIDLVDVSVREGERWILHRLDGRSIPLDPGPHELWFEARGMPPIALTLVIRAGERSRLVSVSFRPASAIEPPEPARAAAPSGGPHSERIDLPSVRSVSSPAPRESEPAPRFFQRLTLGDYALLGTSVGLLGAGIGVGVSARRDEQAAEACEPLCSDQRVRAIRRKGIVADSLLGLSLGTFAFVVVRVALRKPSQPSAQLLLGPTFVGSRMAF